MGEAGLALPFLTAFAPSGGYPTDMEKERRHKPLSERARDLLDQARRGLPGRSLIVVTNGGYTQAFPDIGANGNPFHSMGHSRISWPFWSGPNMAGGQVP